MVPTPTEAQATARARRGRAAIAIAVVAALALCGVAYLTPRPAGVVPIDGAVKPVQEAGGMPPAVVPGPLPPATPVPDASPAPSFDVVRVSPGGSAVIAGRAEPGAEVVVRDGTTEIARTQADRQGSFVAVPAAPLPEGGRSLTLDARGARGVETRSEGAVVVVVPPQAPARAGGGAAGPAMAVLVPGTGAPRVLGERPAAGAGAIGLDTVDYDDKGAIRFTGHAVSGSGMRVYVDNRAVGDAAADGAGRWVLTPGDAVSPGVHTLRVDRLDSAGRVTARVELPFQRASLPAAELAGGRIVVQPGESLWRMARSAYGSGVRYTVIYLANRDTIRDPRLIYPGQAFTVPAAAR